MNYWSTENTRDQPTCINTSKRLQLRQSALDARPPKIQHMEAYTHARSCKKSKLVRCNAWKLTRTHTLRQKSKLGIRIVLQSSPSTTARVECGTILRTHCILMYPGPPFFSHTQVTCSTSALVVYVAICQLIILDQRCRSTISACDFTVSYSKDTAT